ncbi:DUF2855 family protein [Pseudahrensia aquimaris]|uniref:DUF2855 family protein n=1 Tax=Pseudahrensia aquimaris TaxID=744461 RepID=A0ABW3FKS3_9HYPH
MTQFQVRKSAISDARLVEDTPADLPNGSVRVRVEKFGLSANNITYAVAGDTLGYWQFFQPADDAAGEWGIFPVWGFGEVVESQAEGMAVGERLFGYFPPADSIVMHVSGLADSHFFDGSEHRLKLPKGYNIYQRLSAEPGYNSAHDDLRMLFFPLYLTSFAIWDQLKENDWYGAEQVIVVSASSKTSIGLAYALAQDDDAPACVGVTSAGNLEFTKSIGVYDEVTTYDAMEDAIAKRPSAIVDMSGNADVLGRLHTHLGEAMLRTLDVGLTHWEGARKNEAIIRDRREFFFAPAHVQKRMEDWGPAEFSKRSNTFIMETAAKSMAWLELDHLDGLEAMKGIYNDVVDGKAPPQKGLLIRL